MRRSRLIAFSVCLIAVLATTVMLVGTSGDTRIVDAAMQNDLATVRSLIKQATDVNISQGDGMTALHWAALNGNSEMADTLVHAGANVRATTRLGGYTPLFMAAKSGFPAVIEVLIKAGADAKAAAIDGITPLMMAASSGNIDSLERLIQAGADVNAIETERGQTALVFAATFNQADAIKVLLRHGAEVNKKSKPLKPAVRAPQGAVQPPQQQGQAAQGQQPAQRGQRGQQEPAAPPAQQAAQGQQAPQAPAGQRGQRGQQGQGGQVPRDSQRSGGNPRGELTPLMYAARQGHMNAIRALLEGGANINEVSGDHSTALVLASINGHFDVAKYLVEQGADLAIATLDGVTPLYAIVNTQWAPQTDIPQPSTKYEKTHYLDLMKLELDRGADPNARLRKDPWYTVNKESTNAAGTTPFWKCAAVGDIDGMHLLIGRGADPNIPNVDGITALLVAAGAGFHGNNEMTAPYGRLAAVQYLVEEMHADINTVDSAAAGPRNDTMNTSRAAGGFTALHAAAARGDNVMIMYLVSKGAHVDAVSRNGTTVVDMANGPRQRVQPYPETVALLEMLGSVNSHKCVSC
jgi:ankyrin repeat protein